MPRTETRLSGNRRSAIGEFGITESFTLRCDLPCGTVLRSDGAGFWSNGRMSYYGEAPQGWDESKAYPERHAYYYEMELDYS